MIVKIITESFAVSTRALLSWGQRMPRQSAITRTTKGAQGAAFGRRPPRHPRRMGCR